MDPQAQAKLNGFQSAEATKFPDADGFVAFQGFTKRERMALDILVGFTSNPALATPENTATIMADDAVSLADALLLRLAQP